MGRDRPFEAMLRPSARSDEREGVRGMKIAPVDSVVPLLQIVKWK
jgi:hypothetical protein